MISLPRVLSMSERHVRDLLRHHFAVGLLIVLPLSFYFSSASQAGTHILVLSGYRPIELLLGRLLFLGPFGLLIAAGFSTLMWAISHPTRPWILVFGVAMVALVAVPFGLAVGAAVPTELEGTLVLIGVVGMQLATTSGAIASKLLPFYGARRLIDSSSHPNGPIAWPSLLTVAYALGLLVLARVLVSQRVSIQRHGGLSS